ncbi:hypothetical protein LBMAG52_40750 [Planctomycetia bacterium]|nr:hypothetical protein LBMAG52_40750 [Planctomycetia bacterium]
MACVGSSDFDSSAANKELVTATNEQTTAMQNFMGDSELAGGEFGHSMPRQSGVKLARRIRLVERAELGGDGR